MQALALPLFHAPAPPLYYIYIYIYILTSSLSSSKYQDIYS